MWDCMAFPARPRNWSRHISERDGKILVECCCTVPFVRMHLCRPKHGFVPNRYLDRKSVHCIYPILLQSVVCSCTGVGNTRGKGVKRSSGCLLLHVKCQERRWITEKIVIKDTAITKSGINSLETLRE